MITYLTNLAALIKKNVIVLARAKTSALVVLMGPLLLILLAGLAFDNTNTYAVSVGIYSEKYNELSNAFVQRLSENRFKVTKFSTLDDCTLAIRKGEIHLCANFAKDLTVGKNATIDFYVDYSRINLVWTIINTMTQRVMERNYEISGNLTRTLLKTVETTEQETNKIGPALVRLTTNNMKMSKEATGMQAEIIELDTKFDSDKFQIEEISKKKQLIKQWTENAISIGQQAIKDAESYINVAHQSAASNEDVQAAMAKAVSSLEEQKKRMEQTKTLVQNDFKTISELIDNLMNKIKETQKQVDNIARVQKISERALQQINSRLEASIIDLLDIQNSINNIHKEIQKIPIRDEASIVQPIETVIRPVVAEKTYLQYLFPVLMLLVIMFTSIIIPPTLILIEKKSPALIRNYLTPTKNYTYMLATFLSSFILLLGQLVLVLLIAGIFFKAQIFASLPETITILLITTSLFILIGMLIGYLFNTEETAMLTSVTIATISLLMSDAIIPIETMPEWLLSISKLNPFVIGTEMLRKTLVFSELTGTGKGILQFLLYAIILIIACWLAYSSTNREQLKKYLTKIKGKEE